jgi:sodium/proline symporter
MYFSKIIAVIIYIAVLLGVALLSYRKHQSSNDYIIGGRSLNFWLTALAAHASDMSSWLLMAYPAVIFTQGLFQAWIGIGLIIFMYLNWKLVAPRIRSATEKYNSMTLSSFFESRYNDTSGLIRIITALMLFFFYTIYVSAGLIGLGLLVESLFNCNYYLAISIGICVVIPYLFIGGYVTLAWTDLFQGLFLMAVCIFVPCYVIYHTLGSFQPIILAAAHKKISLALVPDFKFYTFVQILMIIGGWGLGYFGQPHIITKFMGIRKTSEMKKAMYVGMSWQIITIGCATLIGLAGIAYHPGLVDNPQLVFVSMVTELFTPVLAAFILCAIFAATISTMDSQILVLVSSFAEDFYKRVFHKNASSKTILFVSRTSIFIVSALAYAIAFTKFSTIFSLVSYAWSGLGATFGPVLIAGLFTKNSNKYGAWAGISSGGIVAGVWPYFNHLFKIDVPSIIPGFLISFLCIWFFSLITKKKHLRIEAQEQA